MGSIIKAARLRAGLSQDDLGRAVGVTQQQVGKWERGENVPTTSRVAHLAEALGLSVDELVTAGAALGPPTDRPKLASRALLARRLDALEERVAALEAREPARTNLRLAAQSDRPLDDKMRRQIGGGRRGNRPSPPVGHDD